MTCYPPWHTKYAGLSTRTVASGCSTVNGNVQCDPAEMAARAGVSLPVYAIARYMQSEVGTGSIEERVAVGEAAVNRAKLAKTDVLARLLYRQPAGHPNRGYFGPIHEMVNGVRTSPYGRWAATSKDPTVQTLALAELVMSGGSGNFALGADDQNGEGLLSNPAADVREQAADGDYWVGPLPGVDPMRTFLYRHYGVAPDSPVGAALLARGLAAVAAKSGRPIVACVDDGAGGSRLSGGAIVGMFLLGSAALAGVIYLGRRAGGQPWPNS